MWLPKMPSFKTKQKTGSPFCGDFHEFLSTFLQRKQTRKEIRKQSQSENNFAKKKTTLHS